jgi:hypothetical protein
MYAWSLLYIVSNVSTLPLLQILYTLDIYCHYAILLSGQQVNFNAFT